MCFWYDALVGCVPAGDLDVGDGGGILVSGCLDGYWGGHD